MLMAAGILLAKCLLPRYLLLILEKKAGVFTNQQCFPRLSPFFPRLRSFSPTSLSSGLGVPLGPARHAS